MVKSNQTLTYQYECILTHKTYKTTAAASHPEELVSIEGYYELYPEKDDRPRHCREQKKD